MNTKINEFEEEWIRLRLQTERLHELMTSKIGESWNAEGKTKNSGELPSDFLL